jgi:hypothetical protein
MSTLATRLRQGAHLSASGLDARQRAELLELPAECFSGLPVTVRIVAQGLGITHPIQFDSRCNLEPSPGINFDGEEVRALAIGAQAERLCPADFKGFCLRKLQDPSFRVTAGLALDGAQPEATAPWSLERVLRWLELELCAAELGEEQPEFAGVIAAA